MGRRFKLVPLEQKSATEQLWEAARVATLHLYKSKYKKFNIREDQREELFSEIISSGVDFFIRHKVIGKKYNRDYDFFANVTSAVWSVMGKVIGMYFRDMTEWGELLSMEYEPDGVGSALKNCVEDTDGHHLLYPDYRRSVDFNELKGGHRLVKYQDEYENLRYYCEQNGRKMVSFEEFVHAVGPGDEEDRNILEYCSKPRKLTYALFMRDKRRAARKAHEKHLQQPIFIDIPLLSPENHQ